ncbi:class D sortase [Planomicrobium sp. CPCC 101079]|uniref:class D sortase n=1 Tax=Planomicrobium sp. CPCC 101079 TaxID=2599618 RepID=UPI002103623A|nr:class D sortase [Planomicrobium sp. CPCC 101079]
MLILVGVLFTGWNGYVWFSEMSSGREPIGENDIAEADEVERLESVSIDVSEPVEEASPAKNLEDPLDEETKLSSKKAKKPKEPEQPKRRDYKEYKAGEKIGWLLIPSLDMKYPLYWGTDDETLTQGVGYHAGNFTTPPDGQRHTVLSGHRDTVFRELGDLKEGDKMFVQFEGVQYEYKIKKTWVTDAEDRTVIVAKDEPTLTLTTCYPFTFIGAAPDRYIIEAPLVNITKMES